MVTYYEHQIKGPLGPFNTIKGNDITTELSTFVTAFERHIVALNAFLNVGLSFTLLSVANSPDFLIG